MASATSSPIECNDHVTVDSARVDERGVARQPTLVPEQEPVARKTSAAIETDWASESPSTDLADDEFWSDSRVDLQMDERFGPSCPHGSRTEVVIKNTFITLKSFFEDESPTVRHCLTEPAPRPPIPYSLVEGAEAEVPAAKRSEFELEPVKVGDLPIDDECDDDLPPVRRCRTDPVSSRVCRQCWEHFFEDSAEDSPAVRRCHTDPAAAARARRRRPLEAAGGHSGPHQEDAVDHWRPASRSLALQTKQLGSAEAPGKVTISVQDRNVTTRQVGSACRVQWTIDAKKMRSTDKQVVSPPLHVTLQEGADPTILKVALYPKGMASFKKAGGVGHVQLKCCSELPWGARCGVMVSVGCGSEIEPDGFRGPLQHDFGSSSVFYMPKDQADWHFGELVDSSGLTLTVVVEIAPLAL